MLTKVKVQVSGADCVPFTVEIRPYHSAWGLYHNGKLKEKHHSEAAAKFALGDRLIRWAQGGLMVGAVGGQ